MVVYLYNQPVTTYQSHDDLVPPVNWFKGNLLRFFCLYY